MARALLLIRDSGGFCFDNKVGLGDKSRACNTNSNISSNINSSKDLAQEIRVLSRASATQCSLHPLFFSRCSAL